MAELVTNGADSLYSYSKNSAFQRKAIDSAKEQIKDTISEKLDIGSFSSSSETFRVTDLGCSVGPNTFVAVENILEAVEHKYRAQGQKVPEFQVYFSDQAGNDFNELFQSLPKDRNYYAMGVPGSFHTRLFPTAHLHFVYSSFSLQYLSKVPELVLDRASPAYNRGRIHYLNAAQQVRDAYEAQYAYDMECFLNARAQEIVSGGLMAFVVPGCLYGTTHEENLYNISSDILGSCFMDMVKQGIIDEDKVDTFNLPFYFTTLQEVETIVTRHGCFSVERMEHFSQDIPEPKVLASSLRSGMEKMIQSHFGQEILDEFFDTLFNKFEDSASVFNTLKATSLFVLLKRKPRTE